MLSLLEAIESYVADNSSGPLTSTITGGFHLNQAPSGTTMPYCTITGVSAPATSAYTAGVAFTEPEIQFNVYAVTGVAARNLMNSLVSAFDNHTFSLITGKNNHMERTADPLPLSDLPERDEQGNRVYGFFVTYRYGVTR